MRLELRCSLERNQMRNPKLTSSPFDFQVHDYALQTAFRTILCITARNEIGLPFWELKTRSRGGIKGGVRVYLFIADDMAFCVNAEIKPEDKPNANKLEEVAIIFRAYKAGKQIFQEES